MSSIITVYLLPPYDVTINWGDGSEEAFTNLNQPADEFDFTEITHEYTIWDVTSGTGTNQFPQLSILGPAQGIDIPTVVQTVVQFSDEVQAISFYNSDVLTEVPNYLPPSVTSIAYMFQDCTIFNSPNVSNWDISNVTNLLYTFSGATNFSQDLNNWNTSNVTNMEDTFSDMDYNLPLTNWDTSSVTRMTRMFQSNTVFNQDIGMWDVSNVTDFTSMIGNAVYDKDLTCWAVENIPATPGGFYGSASWTTQPLWGQSNTDPTNRTGASCYTPPVPEFIVIVDLNEGTNIV